MVVLEKLSTCLEKFDFHKRGVVSTRLLSASSSVSDQRRTSAVNALTGMAPGYFPELSLYCQFFTTTADSPVTVSSSALDSPVTVSSPALDSSGVTWLVALASGARCLRRRRVCSDSEELLELAALLDPAPDPTALTVSWKEQWYWLMRKH